ncbi:MAG: hypothetical protein ACE5R4_14130 [Armatimonadota bacterium]
MASDNATEADLAPEATLAPPPRRVPPAVQIVCLFGGTKGCLWFWLFFGALGVWGLLETLLARYTVAWSAVGLVVFSIVTVIALLLVAASVREGLKERRLLVHGQFAVGRVTDDEGLGPKVSRLTLEVTADSGERLEVRGTAYWDDFPEPQPRRRLLYDPTDPDNTLLLDNDAASHPPQLDGRGDFRRPGLAEVCVALSFPLLVLLVPVRGLVVLLIWGLDSPAE